MQTVPFFLNNLREIYVLKKYCLSVAAQPLLTYGLINQMTPSVSKCLLANKFFNLLVAKCAAELLLGLEV